MSKIKLALNVVGDLKSLAESIETLVNAVEEKEEVEKYKEVKKEIKVQTYSLEEVRAVLASLSQAGKQVQVKSLITSFGAKKLSDIPDTQYPELLEKASEL